MLQIIRGPRDAPLKPLEGRTAAVLGFGNQGAAHAMNLRDSGIDVIVANRRDSDNGRRAVACGFAPVAIEEAVRAADLVIVALPDETHGQIWRERIRPNLGPGTTVGFLHGFSVRYGQIDLPDDVGVILVAPKGPGRTLRRRFERGQGIPCLFAVHQELPAAARTGGAGAEALGLAWANGIGCARAAIVYTSFADEAETDLFGEQAVLCGGMTGLILAAFETLVEAGYPPELAYMECCQEVKQVADLVYERGIAAMLEAISNTAEFGAYGAAARLIDATVRERIKGVLDDVRDGTFARSLDADYQHGFPWFERCRREHREHDIEPAGAAVRSWMPWLDEEETP